MSSRTTPSARRRHLIAAALAGGALALSLTACGSGTDGGVDKARPVGGAATAPTGDATGDATGSPAQARPPATPAERGGPRTARAQATETAEKSVAGGKVTSAKLERDNSAQVWKVDVMTAEPRVHHVKVDAATGALLGSRADRMPDRARPYLEIPLARLAEATVDRDGAAAVALRGAGAGFVSELSVQGDRGAPRWQVEVTDGTVRHRIDVDAKSGAVTAHTKEEHEEQEEQKEPEEPAVSPAGSGGATTPSTDSTGSDGSTGDRGGRPSGDEIRELSHDYGRDHYDWTQHLPR
ncbi:PepSY domain-containing protein [Streptomyces sp. NPDC098789]|uniref:PepSY domain-containing protein n=1 Tax=Streptomyces sp. NPDC098789 TaxID=3366098 RepID=UPI00382A871E